MLAEKERKDLLTSYEKGVEGEEQTINAQGVKPVTSSTHTALKTLEAARHNVSESTSQIVTDKDTATAVADKLSDDMEKIQSKLSQQKLSDDKVMMSQKEENPLSVSSVREKGDMRSEKDKSHEIKAASSIGDMKECHPAEGQNQLSSLDWQKGHSGVVMTTEHANQSNFRQMELKASSGLHQYHQPYPQYQQPKDNHRGPQEAVETAKSQMGVIDATQHRAVSQPQSLSAVTIQLQQQGHLNYAALTDTAGISQQPDLTYLARMKADLKRQLALHQVCVLQFLKKSIIKTQITTYTIT